MEHRQLRHQRHWTVGCLVSLFVIAVLLPPVRAQNYSIDWFKVAGGGGASTNGQYSINGSIGQHDAGVPMTGGTYSITGGFWSLLAAAQTPGAPLLSIRLTGTNTAIIYWPASSTTFTLQQNSNTGVPNWGSVTNAVNVVGGQCQVIVSPPVGNQFYRLKYP